MGNLHATTDAEREAARQQTIETVTTLYNGKLRLERRNANPTIHARTFLHGKTIGKSTGETTTWSRDEKLLTHQERQADISVAAEAVL